MVLLRVIPPEQLEEMILRKPLTRDAVQETLRDKIRRAVFIENAEWAVIWPEGDVATILIGLKRDPAGFGTDPTHEVCHANYGARGTPHNQEACMRIETLIEEEARRFYEGDKEFVDELVRGYFVQNGLTS